MLNNTRFPYWLLASIAIGAAFAMAVIGFANQRAVPTSQETPVARNPVVGIAPAIEALPSDKLLEVPFIVQAPNGNWDALHKEACEEASLLMVRYYKTKTSFSSISETDQLMINFINWQSANGYKVDVTVSQLKQAASDYFDFNGAEVIESPTIEQIKREIANGHPVIVPAAGQLLGNPNFTPPGPRYHMLVIIGYDEDEFITHDPGTRNGKGYRYQHSILMNAVHDFTSGDITNGPAKVLVYR